MQSASAPADRSSAANASAYPLTIHCAVDSAPPRSEPIGPRATFTIVASSVIMRKPRQIAVSPSARLCGLMSSVCGDVGATACVVASESMASMVRLGGAVLHDL
jgi:hypothetical protein